MGAPRGSLKGSAYRERLRVILLLRDGRHCVWCGDRMTWPHPMHVKSEMTFEHMTRRCDGGSNAPSNLALACRACNNDRG